MVAVNEWVDWDSSTFGEWAGAVLELAAAIFERLHEDGEAVIAPFKCWEKNTCELIQATQVFFKFPRKIPGWLNQVEAPM